MKKKRLVQGKDFDGYAKRDGYNKYYEVSLREPSLLQLATGRWELVKFKKVRE